MISRKAMLIFVSLSNCRVQFMHAVTLIYSLRKQDVFFCCVYGTRFVSLKFSDTVPLILKKKSKKRIRKKISKNKAQIRKRIPFDFNFYDTYKPHFQILMYEVNSWVQVSMEVPIKAELIDAKNRMLRKISDTISRIKEWFCACSVLQRKY